MYPQQQYDPNQQPQPHPHPRKVPKQPRKVPQRQPPRPRPPKPQPQLPPTLGEVNARETGRLWFSEREVPLPSPAQTERCAVCGRDDLTLTQYRKGQYKCFACIGKPLPLRNLYAKHVPPVTNAGALVPYTGATYPTYETPRYLEPTAYTPTYTDFSSYTPLSSYYTGATLGYTPQLTSPISYSAPTYTSPLSYTSASVVSPITTIPSTTIAPSFTNASYPSTSYLDSYQPYTGGLLNTTSIGSGLTYPTTTFPSTYPTTSYPTTTYPTATDYTTAPTYTAPTYTSPPITTSTLGSYPTANPSYPIVS